jgi:hypothetical protein
MTDERWRFERIGLGYHVSNEELQTDIRVTRLKRSSGELHGEIRVTTNLEGVKTVNGVLHLARFNLSSTTTRERLAKTLEKRTPGFDFDWWDGIEHLCQNVMLEESKGQPYLEIGQHEGGSTEELYLVEPLIPANVPSIIYAEGGSGKSVFALANALSIKTGWQYIPGFLPVETGEVLYLDWETDANVINHRIQRISLGVGQPPPRLLYRRCIRPLYEEAEEVANQVAERGVRFLVIDSAGMAMGGAGERGDANENTLRLFDAIRHINVTTQIIDHVSKQEARLKGMIRGRLPYGSIYKINLSRSAWEVRTTPSEDDEDRIRATFLHVKANDSKLHDDITVDIEWGSNGGPIRFVEAEADIEYMMDKDSVAEAIIDMMMEKDGPMMSKTSVSNALPQYKKNTVWKTIDRMVEKGRLLNGPPGYRLPVDSEVDNGQPGMGLN